MSLAPVRWIGSLLDLAVKVRGLMETQDRHGKAIIKFSEDLQALRADADARAEQARVLARLTEEVQAIRLDLERLRVREEVLIARAEQAASAAAGAAMTLAVSDLSRRLGVIEGRLPRLTGPDTPPG